MVIKQLLKELPGLKEPVEQLLEEVRASAREKGLEEGREEGLEEGREEGTFLTLQKNLFDLLEARLGVLDKKTLAAVRSIKETKILQALFKKTLHVKSEEALREAIAAQAATAKSNGRHNGRPKIVRGK